MCFRMGHLAIADEDAGQVWYMGGFGSVEDGMLSNPASCAFDMEKSKFMELAITSMLPYGSMFWGNTVARAENSVWVMGGFEYMKLSNKLWEFEMERMEVVDDDEEVPELEQDANGEWKPKEEGAGGTEGSAHDEL